MPQFNPFQEGDFVDVPTVSGMTETRYSGPIFKVRYPKGADDMQEWVAWLGLGYQVDLSYSNGDGSFTLHVMGDIPDVIQDRFRKNGVGVELYRARETPTL